MSAEFLWRMEDVLDLYARAYDPAFPVVCMDEHPYQLLEQVYEPMPAQPGRAKREDYEYRRRGVCNLFLFFQPLAGWRQVWARPTRTKRDFAECMQRLVDEWFPDAEEIHVVLDNLNTHNPSSFYERFEPSEARRLTRKLRFHYTPVHGSWLNMVEIEHSILARQCVRRRIGDIETLQRECDVWAEQRSERKATVDWRFTTEDARDKFHRFYTNNQRV